MSTPGFTPRATLERRSWACPLTVAEDAVPCCFFDRRLAFLAICHPYAEIPR